MNLYKIGGKYIAGFEIEKDELPLLENELYTIINLVKNIRENNDSISKISEYYKDNESILTRNYKEK